jgi:hypothetical protein
MTKGTTIRTCSECLIDESRSMIQAKLKIREIAEVPDLNRSVPITEDFGCTFGLAIGPATGASREAESWWFRPEKGHKPLTRVRVFPRAS